MRRIFKWVGVGLGSIIALLALALAFAYGVTTLKLNRSIDGVGEPVTVPSDAASIAEGRRLVVARGCVDCHGDTMGGSTVIDDPLLGRVVAPNLTSGANGLGAAYSAADFERAIRHGVAQDGRPLIIMPSHEYYPVSNTDVGAMIAYLEQAAPVDSELPAIRIGPLAMVLNMVGAITLTPVDEIDERAGRTSPTPSITVEYGRYLSTGCTGCHSGNLSGGVSPVPGMPPSANLTPDPASGLGSWSEADFIRALREGVRPDGSAIDPAMPWKNLGSMTDTELRALFLYLQSLEPLPKGTPAS